MRKILFIFIVIISLFIINNLLRSIYDLWQKRNIVVKMENELIKEKKENENLLKQLKEIKKPEFIEQEARNKLFMAKPGEQIVIIPSPTISSSTFNTQRKKVKNYPNWRLWLELFF